EMLERAERPRPNSSDPALHGRRDIFAEAVARHQRELGRADTWFIQLRAGREMESWRYPSRTLPLSAGDRARVALRFAQEGAWRALCRVGLRHLVAKQ